MTKRLRVNRKTFYVVILACVFVTLSACKPVEPLAAGRDYPGNSVLSDKAGHYDRLVVQGVDGNIYTMDPFGSNVVAITEDASGTVQYTQPTWSPLGDRIALTQIETQGDAVEASLVIASSDALHEDDRIQVAVPYPPFYLHWGPTGSVLAYLSAWASAGQPSMALRLVDVDAEDSIPVTLAEGQPFYFSWSPNGESLLAHSQNERLDVLALDGSRTPLHRTTASFPAPQWFPSSEAMLFALSDESRHRLVIADPEGTVQSEVTTFDDSIAFTLSPDERQIAYAVTPVTAGTAAFAPLFVVELESRVTRQLSDLPVLAFFWSPDSQKLAFMEVERAADDLRFRWRVWDGAKTTDFASFLPTRTFAERYLAFFDQYAQSMRIWSPDSTAFTYAAFGPPDTAAPRTYPDNISGIWVQELEAVSPRYVGPGVYVAWSPN